MDVQDHKTITSSEHEIHGVHLCHKCGWPFPNPHPSAKHRRAHKKVCGTIEGYKLIDSGSDHGNLAGSDNEHTSDDERRSPSPNVDKESTKESSSGVGMSLKSNRSEDELFSDAVTDFSDNGVSPSLEEGSESVKKVDKNVGGEFLHDLEQSHVTKDEKTADTSQPLDVLTQLPQGSVKASEMADSDVMRSERNQSEITKSMCDTRNENVSVGVSSTNCLESNSSQVVSKLIVVSDISTTDSEMGKQKDLILSGPGTNIKEKGKGDEAVDVHGTTASEVPQSEHKLEIVPKLEDTEGKTSGPVAQEATALETDKETLDPRVDSDFESKLNNANGETSDTRMVDEIVNKEKVGTNDIQFKQVISYQIEPVKLQDDFLVSKVESGSAKNLICRSTGMSEEVCDLKEAGNENTHLLSTAEILPAEENLDVMSVLKSGGPLDLGAAEEVRSAEDDKNVPDPENLQIAISDVPAGGIDNSSSDAFEVNLEKQGASVSVGGAVGISVPKNIPRALSSVPAGTVDDLKEEGVSTPVGGEVGTFVPDLPIAHSSVHAQNLVNSSSKMAPDLENLQNALSNVSAGSLENSSSDALEGDLEREGVSTPIDREVCISVPESLPNALSSVLAGTVDNSSLDALEDDLKKEGVSTCFSGEVVGTSVTENLPSPLSSVPAGTEVDSLLNALKEDLKKEGVSTPIGGEVVGTSVTKNLPSSLASVPAGTVVDSSLDTLKDDLKKEGVSTPICGEVSTSIPALATADSTVPAGMVGNSSSVALGDDLKKKDVSTSIGGDVDTSDQGSLPSSLLNVPARMVNSSSEPLEGDLNKEGVSTISDGEVGASIPENLQSALPSIPAGSADNTSSDALEDNLEKEYVSRPSDGRIGTSVPDNLPTALSSVPAGIADNSTKEASEDGLKKEGVSTPIDMEVGSPGIGVASDEDTHLLSVAGTLSAVENSNVMTGDFKDYKVLKSSFSLDIGAAEEIKSVEDDTKVNVSDNPGVLSNVPAGSIDNSSSDALEDDLKKEGVSIPIDGEVGASGFMGTSDEDHHLLSVADTSPAVENPEVMFGEFKDYKVLKSSFPLDLGAAEEIRSEENDQKVTVPENLPSAFSNAPAGSTDNSSSDALEDDLKKESVSIPIDGEIGASEFRVAGDADFVSSGLGDHPKTSGSKANNSQPNNNVERSLPQSVDRKSFQNEEQSDVIPLESSASEETLQTTNLCRSENADTQNGNVQAGDEPSASITTTLTDVEAIAETTEKPILLAGDQSLDLENSSMGFSSIAGNETAEVAAEERLVKQTHSTYESTEQSTNSASLDEARGSNQVNIDVRESGELSNSSELPKCSDEIPHSSEGLKMGEETEVPRSSAAPAAVSELKYEDPTLSSERTPENSRSIEIADIPIEYEFLNDDGKDKVTRPNFSVPAGDNSIASSSRTDSLEGNWGSVSVLSTQSDVTAGVLSTDTQAAEKLDDAFTKPGGASAMEYNPDKSDVFEPPSFMTLVESGSGIDKNASASEIQTLAKKDEQSKSEALQAGWFPSITNVVNESEGRKKNEEIIAKVTNWSTGKQHGPLKNLLSEAHAETKVKSSPDTKQVPADETASNNNNGTAVTTVSSILGSEVPTAADTVKKEMEKEWNSPARYPIQMKKEKRKGKPYWVPFVCCTSVHQDI